MVKDMTGMDVANASLLDEGTAAAESMLICYSSANPSKNIFFVDKNCFIQTIACVKTRAAGFGINVIVGDFNSFDFTSHSGKVFGALIQYPAADGSIHRYESFVKTAHENGALVACATDLLALSLLKSPGEFGVDICLGNSQRFGVPLGYGGPHAAFFAVKDVLKRKLPGRLIGVSKDATGKLAYRLALQTREQHIRREKATSNICTAQALLANMAALYAVYHGPEGIRNIAQRVHNLTAVLAFALTSMGYKLLNQDKFFFDTLKIELPHTIKANDVMKNALEKNINLNKLSDRVILLTLDETVIKEDLEDLLSIFSCGVKGSILLDDVASKMQLTEDNPAQFYPKDLIRKSEYLTHPVFNSYHSVYSLNLFRKRICFVI
jgi:glycine dehydrogenase